jgi:branched-chain amino acid transport system ATP-binding protein
LDRDPPLLVMHDVSAQYGRVRALEQIEFTLRSGESLAILGANGAGKTTLLRTISGLMERRSGRILFEGADISREPSHRIVRLGISQVAEGRHLFPTMTVIENLEMGGLVPSTTGRATEVAETLDLVFALFPRLAERRTQLVKTLSGGEQQMVAIGRALMARPRLMLLDEPSVGLAPKVVADLLHALGALKTMGLAIMLAEQNVPLALSLADRAIVLRLGRIALKGDAKDLSDSSEIRQIYLGTE